MRYLRVRWLHSDPDDPAEIFSEIDDKGWETRKVEVFPDGRMGYASADEAAHSTTLSEEPLPSLEEIAADPQFRPVQISKEAFERIWATRLSPATST